MAIGNYDGKKTAVMSVQRQLEAQCEAIRNNQSLSDAGRKSELAKATLAARACVDKMRSEFVAEREIRANNMHKVVFGDLSRFEGAEVIVRRDARDRAAQIDSAEEATAMLHRANQHGDVSLAAAVAEAAFQRGWVDVAMDYADHAGKRGALDVLLDTTPGRLTAIGDCAFFKVGNPEELATATEPVLRDLAQINKPGLGSN